VYLELGLLVFANNWASLNHFRFVPANPDTPKTCLGTYISDAGAQLTYHFSVPSDDLHVVLYTNTFDSTLTADADLLAMVWFNSEIAYSSTFQFANQNAFDSSRNFYFGVNSLYFGVGADLYTYASQAGLLFKASLDDLEANCFTPTVNFLSSYAIDTTFTDYTPVPAVAVEYVTRYEDATGLTLDNTTRFYLTSYSDKSYALCWYDIYAGSPPDLQAPQGPYFFSQLHLQSLAPSSRPSVAAWTVQVHSLTVSLLPRLR